jgi:hypothetical protein
VMRPGMQTFTLRPPLDGRVLDADTLAVCCL